MSLRCPVRCCGLFQNSVPHFNIFNMTEFRASISSRPDIQISTLCSTIAYHPNRVHVTLSVIVLRIGIYFPRSLPVVSKHFLQHIHFRSTHFIILMLQYFLGCVSRFIVNIASLKHIIHQAF